MTAEEEVRHLQSVEHALLQLLNDDITAADKILKQENSSYHVLGRGISSFIASMLASEKELLKDAASTLAAAEAKTWDDMKKAQKEPTAFQSRIYPPGTEYLLCFASIEIMLCISRYQLLILYSLSVDQRDLRSAQWFRDRGYQRVL